MMEHEEGTKGKKGKTKKRDRRKKLTWHNAMFIMRVSMGIIFFLFSFWVKSVKFPNGISFAMESFSFFFKIFFLKLLCWKVTPLFALYNLLQHINDGDSHLLRNSHFTNINSLKLKVIVVKVKIKLHTYIFKLCYSIIYILDKK